MTYPNNFEEKIGFSEIRTLLKQKCLSTLGKSFVDAMLFSTEAGELNRLLAEIREFRRIETAQEEFPLSYFFDCREMLKRIRVEGTYIEEAELFDLKRALQTIADMVRYLQQGDEKEVRDAEGNASTVIAPHYPTLCGLTEGVITFPGVVQRIDQILDKFGHLRDTASPELARIRTELARTEGSISRILHGILRSAQQEGLVEKDASPAMRDGRLVIPVAPGLKRRISGIVHDESASGRTVYVEPTEVVEANNRIRELLGEERHEIIRIMKEVSAKIRPHVQEMLVGFDFMGRIDFIKAKADVANDMRAFEPEVADAPYIDWIQARHPLLERRIAQAPGRSEAAHIVPLDIMLTPEKHVLIISGPNAGGKSVCLKTAGLLQYMLQCGLAIPVGDRSRVGVFEQIMIDIGDEQSLENNLSTYSSHLLNMKNMMRRANTRTLILIDEFGTGTEPQIGGAIAESVLEQFCTRGAWAVITTHYQNLKHFADSHEGVANGAMLYDRHEMRPLFQLAIGRPGSSFAIEIARKIGLPEEVIAHASAIVGSDYIQSDKYLQDIVRDKRYWESKRQNIHQREKDMERTISRYESDLTDIERQRKDILRKAKAEAEELLRESNRRIENAIREIRESQAAKEETRRIRQELDAFKAEVQEVDAKAADEKIQQKIEQIKARRERHAKRQAEKGKQAEEAAKALRAKVAAKGSTGTDKPIAVGDMVHIKGLTSVGRVEQTDGKMATVIFGDMRTKLRVSRLEHHQQGASADTTAADGTPARPLTKAEERAESLNSVKISRVTSDTIADHRKNFHQDLDVRGMRGDEALNAVQYFIDDAILMGMPRVRILHGKGNGILRQLIRQYLATVPNITHYQDEHVQFGGAGITVADIG